MRLLRNAMLALAAVGAAVVATPSCDGDSRADADCDHAEQRCRTYCDYGYSCDSYWGCCYDRCWYECVDRGDRDRVDVPPPPSRTQPPTDGGSAEASAPSSGVAVLCAACTSNDQCKGGGLCIQRGGDDAGASGFCGSPCTASTDCPADFSCTPIGQSQQCVPTSGVCN